MQFLIYKCVFQLKEELHPTQKLACFVCYLKTIINTFLKNDLCI